MAVAAHPDDIEFMMSGTMILLGQASCELHYMNIANGSCGSVEVKADEIVKVRTEEARKAASLIGAVFHDPLVDDITILYDDRLIRKVCAIMRQVKPRILLLPSPQDYMEDHINASRVTVTAAFCRNMPNYLTDPPEPHIESEMAVYHALPYGLRDQLGNRIMPSVFVDIESAMSLKKQMLSCHTSQKQWLDKSQGIGSYIKTMQEMSAEVGRMSGRYKYAEGWRQHLHLGFGRKGFDPLGDVLAKYTSRAKGGKRWDDH